MSALRNLFDFEGKRVTVMGLGRFGGGVGAATFLAQRGARVTITDLLPAEKLAESMAQLQGLPVADWCLGGHRESDFLEADLVVVNPAVPPDNRFLQLARQAGVPLTSEMALFWQHHRGKVVGVTGSNGKSTTAALVHSILQSAGLTSRLGGNIGRSLLLEVDRIGPDDWAVLELSSFQLEDLNRLPASPHVTIVTNFSPNHLDWHGSLADYRRAKQAALCWQTPECVAVLNADDTDVYSWPAYGRRLDFGLTDSGRCGLFARPEGGAVFRNRERELVIPLSNWLRLPGRHNLQNALAAACAALAIGVPLSAVQAGLETFQPLPHRLEFVVETAGRRFYNDSLATTPESAVAALNAFDVPVVLLAGGYDKQIDLDAMAAAVAQKAKAVALMGQTAELLQELVEGHLAGRPLPMRQCRSLDEAFTWAAGQSAAGDVVLLSPGCASYDWFLNFADRGEQFVRLATGWRP